MKKSTSWVVTGVWLLVSSLHFSTAEDCGRQANFALCPNNECCSEYGYCGTSDAYCGSGCQSQCGGEQAECGSQAGFALCPNNLCCSQYGFCGSTFDYCDPSTCQSQCGGGSPSPPPPPGPCSGIACLITESMFQTLWPGRDQIYTYESFVNAAKIFPAIGTEGTQAERLREIAAFAAHVQQETAGLFYTREIDQSFDYCDRNNQQYPCASGQKYFGRGPLQLSWNYNYGAARDSGIGSDILAFPDAVAQDGVISFRASFWFWTRSDGNIPSIHDVIVGKWRPSQDDINNNRRPGFGETINIINGGLECGKPTDGATNRVNFYKQFCNTLGVSPGDNLDCASSTPY